MTGEPVRRFVKMTEFFMVLFMSIEIEQQIIGLQLKDQRAGYLPSPT